MTKIDIFSGFLGAGKTTLIKKLISEAFAGEKLVLIENEFGEIGIDGGFLADAGINITEMNSGCICCSLVGDFGRALKRVLDEYHPQRIIIEPSGVGKLSDVIKAVENTDAEGIVLNSITTVVDAKKCRLYMKNFGEFFNNQIEHAGTIILSHTATLPADKLAGCVVMLRQHNAKAEIVTTDWEKLNGPQLLAAMEHADTLEEELKELEEEALCPICSGHHSHEDGEHGHHHHEHGEECSCGEHHHENGEHGHSHHEHGEECSCGCHHHEEGEHTHHHHADEVFKSWGRETTKIFTEKEILAALSDLENESKYGMVLRAKGIINAGDFWIHFDYTPGEADVRRGGAATTGRLCVIGSKINEDAISSLFD